MVLDERERAQLKIMAEEFGRGVGMKEAIQRAHERVPLLDKYTGKLWIPHIDGSPQAAPDRSALLTP